MKLTRCFHTLALAAVITLLATQTLWAQNTTESDTLDTHFLEPVTVEATHSSVTLDRASMSVTTLNRDINDMTTRRAATMDELTFTMPGVWVSNRDNHALGERMTVRGMGWRSQFGVRGVHVVMDGIPLTVADGQTILNMVDPAMIQSAELLRGPSATFWGNSSGGVLYMRTQPPSDAPSLMLRSYGGSFNTMKHEARWHDVIGGVRWNAYGSYYDTDGYRDHSAARLMRGGVTAGFDVTGNSTLQTRVAYSGMPKGQHPGSLSEEDARENPRMAFPFFANNDAGKDFHQLMSSLNYIHSFESGVLNVSGQGTWRDLTNPLPFGYISVNRWAGNARATYDIDNLPFDWLFGAEMKWQRDDRDQREVENGQPTDVFTTNQLDRVRNQALFTKAVIDLSAFTFSAGLRADRMVFSTEDYLFDESGSRTFTTLNPSLGLNYSFGDANLFANFSTSFESPTTTEFKNRPGGGTGFNPDLDPERAVGIETGLRGFLADLNLDYEFTLFGTRVSDQIVQVDEVDGLAFFSNGGDAEHYGLETHLKMRPSPLFSIEFMYSYLNASFTGGIDEFGQDFEGNRIPGVAPHRIGTTTALHLGPHYLSVDGEWVGEYYVNSENSVTNDAYFLLNSRYSYSGLEFDGWSLQPFASVHNIMDVRYNTSVSINSGPGRYFEPGPGRSFQVGISLQI